MNVRHALIIPSYKEMEALPKLLQELDAALPIDAGIIVVDDSPADLSLLLQLRCSEIVSIERNWKFLPRDIKSGRGDAVIFGIKEALVSFPEATTFLECDADGSHRTEDIKTILSLSSSCSVCIGSRYLNESQIQGWSWVRRVNSRWLNFILPKILGLDVRDVTNGLRSYSREAASALCESKFSTKGFVTLSEQLLILKNKKFKWKEVAITFVERGAGSSSVTASQFRRELVDILKLVINYRIYKRD